MKRDTLSYHGYRFPPDIISHAVWLGIVKLTKSSSIDPQDTGLQPAVNPPCWASRTAVGLNLTIPAQERKAHTEWASTLVEQQQQMGAHVTTLTTEYEGLLKNVNRMIDASNSVTSELEELFR